MLSESLMRCRTKHQFLSMHGHNSRRDHEIPDNKIHGPTWGPPGSFRPQIDPMLAPWTLLSGIINHVLLDILSRFQWLLIQLNIHGGPINKCDSWGLPEPRWTRTYVWNCMSYSLLQNAIWIQPTIQSCFLTLWQVVETFNVYKNCSARWNRLTWGNCVAAWYGPADSLKDTFAVQTDFSLSCHVRYIQI